MKPRIIKAADLFCGAGGTSTGAQMAADAAGVKLELTAINHWDVAIETHSANHPGARHLCADVNDVRPEKFFKRGELDWLFASPECTHFSKARGGLPVDDQRRCGARRVLDWAERIYPARIWVENVQEFLDWGPLDVKGRPIVKHRGALFREWVTCLQTLGYRVEWRIQNAANFGAPTTRQRLIVQAARRGTRLVWPEATHRKPDANGELFEDLPAWLSARDHVIDWSIPCPSIFGRKRPLSPNTLRRIEAGLRAQGIQAFLTNVSHTSDRIRSLDDPLNTITSCTGETAIVTPFLVTLRGTAGHSAVDRPLGAVTTSGKHSMLITPCLIPQQSDGRTRPVTEPVPTVSTAGAIGLMQPTLIEYYGTGTFASCDEPLNTVTCKPRFGLAVPLDGGGEGILDIGYRMLRWRENARAQSFPDSYIFSGRTEEMIHKQIGNAVPPKLAEAHARAALMERRAA
jgi:DNA (cytosine-5)-methyltransferase 1